MWEGWTVLHVVAEARERRSVGRSDADGARRRRGRGSGGSARVGLASAAWTSE
uniref:Uncharacterized protein n=1 Tax=Arundo donax TaxID=35708 RepID=A0A0A9EF06_ARUDO